MSQFSSEFRHELSDMGQIALADMIRIVGPLWGKSPVTGKFHFHEYKGRVMRTIDVFFVVCLSNLLNNQSIQRVTTVMGYQNNTQLL